MVHAHHTHSNVANRLLWVLGFNTLITVAQWVFAYLASSLSLFSDALHNSSDLISLGISLWVLRLPTRKKRFQGIAALLNGGLLVAVSLYLIQESLQRLFSPIPIYSMEVIILAAIGALVNGVSAWVLHRDSKTDLNLHISYLHMFTDVITSLVVCIGGISMYLWECYWLDSALSIAVSLYILVVTARLFLSYREKDETF
jgi:cobalt-zinc-cadmium efflux system protein